jgi:ppGpp synthetase/RelA/SpoT-type nucleotidyltranferase
MDNAASEAVSRFSAEWQRYQDAAEAVAVRVRHTADDAKIHCTVTPRAKDVRSFHKKIFAKNYTNPWQQVTDKAGVRAVVDIARNVDQLVERLQGEFDEDVVSVEDKREVLDPERLSYSGVHVQVVAQHASNDYEAIECEVQIRTAAQDAWSIISHQLLYKPLLDLPPQLQHSIYRLVALVEMFDEEVQRVMDLLPSLPGSEVVDLLGIAENKYLEVAHSPSNRQVGVKILQAIAGSIDPSERANYTELLEAFVNSERETLDSLFADYGPHSAVSYVPSYLLFGQAESLIILERLNARPFLLAAKWRESEMPYDYLETLAGAAGIPMPELCRCQLASCYAWDANLGRLAFIVIPRIRQIPAPSRPQYWHRPFTNPPGFIKEGLNGRMAPGPLCVPGAALWRFSSISTGRRASA